MIEVKVTSSNAGQKAEKFVKHYLKDAPLGFIYKAFRKKDIKVNGHWVKKDHVLYEGDVLRIYVTDQQLEDFKNLGLDFQKDDVAALGLYQLEEGGKRADAC